MCRQTLKHKYLGQILALPINSYAMAPHSSTLAFKNPWMEEPGGLQSMGSLRVRHDWATSLSLFTLMHWRRKWQPTPVFLPWESQGRGSLVGCCLWGRTEVGHDWSDLAAAAANVLLLFKFQCSSFFNNIKSTTVINISKTIYAYRITCHHVYHPWVLWMYLISVYFYYTSVHLNRIFSYYLCFYSTQ